jgi:hypothetical protein
MNNEIRIAILSNLTENILDSSEKNDI